MRFDAIHIEGLAHLNRSLRAIDKEAPKALRLALNTGAEIVVDWARPRVERRTGRAAKSLRVQSTRTAARASGGGPRVPHYPWLDFGGAVGPAKSVERPFYKEGRYLWKGLVVKRDEVAARLEGSLAGVARGVGLEVEG